MTKMYTYEGSLYLVTCVIRQVEPPQILQKVPF